MIKYDEIIKTIKRAAKEVKLYKLYSDKGYYIKKKGAPIKYKRKQAVVPHFDINSYEETDILIQTELKK